MSGERAAWCVVLWLAVAALAACPTVCAQETRDGLKLVPLYRFEARNRVDYLYTVRQAEVESLKAGGNYTLRGIVGYGASINEEAPGLVVLRRYRDERGFHYFANFLTRPNRNLKLETLGIKVWRSRSPGMAPVFASSDLDGRSIYFALSRQALEKHDDDYRQATGRRRKNLGVVFYMYPPNYQQPLSVPPEFAAVDWGLLRGDKYRYAPAAVEYEGRRYLFYSGNIDRPDRPRICDHLLVRTGELVDGEWRFGDETVVIAPGDDWNRGVTPWDRHRAGDPSVVRGEFTYQRPGQNAAEQFPWALFYSALDKPLGEGGTHRVALALARELTGPWHKVGVVVPAEAGRGWGAGVPTALNLDQGARLLLIYSLRDADSEQCHVRELDLTDAGNPVVVSQAQLASAGLSTSFGTPDSVPSVGSLMLDRGSGRAWRIRAQNPRPSIPPQTSTSVQIASIPLDQLTAADGVWTVHADFGASDYGFVRMFSPGFVRSPEGHVMDPQVLDVYISTGTREGSQTDWIMSYRIHALRIDRSKVDSEDAGPGSIHDVPGVEP